MGMKMPCWKERVTSVGGWAESNCEGIGEWAAAGGYKGFGCGSTESEVRRDRELDRADGGRGWDGWNGESRREEKRKSETGRLLRGMRRMMLRMRAFSLKGRCEDDGTDMAGTAVEDFVLSGEGRRGEAGILTQDGGVEMVDG